jgi:hypothetical protein
LHPWRSRYLFSFYFFQLFFFLFRRLWQEPHRIKTLEIDCRWGKRTQTDELCNFRVWSLKLDGGSQGTAYLHTQIDRFSFEAKFTVCFNTATAAESVKKTVKTQATEK